MTTPARFYVSASYSAGNKISASSRKAEMVFDPEAKLWSFVDHEDCLYIETELGDWDGGPVRLYENNDPTGMFYVLRDALDPDADYYKNCPWVDVVADRFTVIAWGVIESEPVSDEFFLSAVRHNERDWYVALPVVNPNSIGKYKPFVLDALNELVFWHPDGWDGGLTYARRPNDEEIEYACVGWNSMLPCEKSEADFWVRAVTSEQWEGPEQTGC